MVGPRVLWATLSAVSVAHSTVAFAPPPLAPVALAPGDAPRAGARAGGLARLGPPTVRMAASRDRGGAEGNYTHSTMQVTGKGALWQDYELDTRLIKVAPAALSALPRPAPHADANATVHNISWGRLRARRAGRVPRR